MHRYGCFDKESAEFYRDIGKVLLIDNPLDIGLRREIRLDLMKKYGLSELEAINVLNGRNMEDYVVKYKRSWIDDR